MMRLRSMNKFISRQIWCDIGSKRFCRQRFGMTLVEVLAVVVILGLIAATLLVSFSGSFGKAKHELAKTGIGLLASKVELYKIDKGDWPGMEQGLMTLTDPLAKPDDPYYVSHDQILDPWNHPYHYLTPGPNGHPYEIVTYGADNQPGGEGENADLSSASLREQSGTSGAGSGQ